MWKGKQLGDRPEELKPSQKARIVSEFNQEMLQKSRLQPATEFQRNMITPSDAGVPLFNLSAAWNHGKQEPSSLKFGSRLESRGKSSPAGNSTEMNIKERKDFF
jgi:hypothetical protein